MKKYLIIILCLFIVTGCMSKNKKETEIKLDKNGNTKEEVKTNDLTFNDIKLNYNGSITLLTSNIKNTTNKAKNIKVTIILKKDNKEVKKLNQIIENIEPNSNKKINVGIVGDYSEIKDVEFKIVEEF